MWVPISVTSWLKISSIDCSGSKELADEFFESCNLCAAVWRSTCFYEQNIWLVQSKESSVISGIITFRETLGSNVEPVFWTLMYVWKVSPRYIVLVKRNQSVWNCTILPFHALFITQNFVVVKQMEYYPNFLLVWLKIMFFRPHRFLTAPRSVCCLGPGLVGKAS